MARQTRWAAALAAALLAIGLAGDAGSASRAKPQVGKALGGKANPAYKPLRGKKTKLLRPLRGKGARGASNGPALTLRLARFGDVGYLSPQHYKDVRDVSLKLLRLHPPDKHYFVAVGRSPVAIASFLAELNEDMVMTFPASDMRLEIRPEWKQQYFDHFKELIPDDVLQGDRTIVLFDRSRANSGTSLARLKGFLEEYLASVGSRTKVAAVGMAPSGPLAAGVQHLSTAKHPSVFLYRQGQYDHDESVAPFPNKHRIGVNQIEDLVENPNHWKFRDALKTRMADDAELDQALTAEFADLLGDD